MVNLFDLFQFCRSRMLGRSLAAGALSLVGVFSGLVPIVTEAPGQGSLTLSFSNGAYAQAINEQELQNYARSVLAIEPIRRTAYDEIKRILGTGDVPAIACHRPNSLNSLQPNIRQIARNYCNRAIQIVERNQLTINRFNTITVTLQSNPRLATQIQEELIRIQQNSNR